MEMGNSAPTEGKLSRSLPIERKLPLLILGVLAFVLAVSLGISYYAIRRSAVLAASERLTSLSRVLGPMVQGPITSRLPLMIRAAHDSAVIKAFADPNSAPSLDVGR